MLYRVVANMNKNERVTFEGVTKEKALEYAKDTLTSARFAKDNITGILVYEVKEVGELTYDELLSK